MRILALLLLLFARPLAACEVALVVALDVSRSVDKYEYVLMRDGIASAFLDEDVADLIVDLPGGIMATVTQWGGMGQQRQVVGWRPLRTRGDIAGFVQAFAGRSRGFWMADTAVSEALLHADLMFETQPDACRRKVIDISGDGIANAGEPVWPISRAIGSKGVTINGLVVKGARRDPVIWYQEEVIAGPLPFVETAESYDDYTRAMTRKLLRELTPALAMAR